MDQEGRNFHLLLDRDSIGDQEDIGDEPIYESMQRTRVVAHSRPIDQRMAWRQDQVNDSEEENKVQVISNRPDRITLNNYEDSITPNIDSSPAVINPQQRDGKIYFFQSIASRQYEYYEADHQEEESKEYDINNEGTWPTKYRI